MASLGPFAQVFLYALLSILAARASPQSTTPNSKLPRIHLDQDQLCCFTGNFVEPIYPREARLARIEGLVKLTLIIADDGSIADLQGVSGDPLLVDSTLKALRQWRFSPPRMVGSPRAEAEVPITFTFKIQDPPEPAYLHLRNGTVIRANNVREFIDRVEYTAGRSIHHLPSDSVTDISACARVSLRFPLKEGDCIPGGGPYFSIHAIPLLPAVKTGHSNGATAH
jgi:TonB family protein